MSRPRLSRARVIARSLTTSLTALVLGSAACLPEDDTPPPGTATFVVRGDPAVATLPPFEDGWTVTVTRALVLVSRAYQADPLCDVYSESSFEPTIVNALYPGDASLGRVRGLGPCRSALIPGGLPAIARLGPGATEADRSALTTDPALGELASGPSLRLDAVAERGDERLTMSLLVPAQGLYLRCPRDDGDDGYVLRTGDAQTFVLAFDLARVFADGPRPSRRLRFAPFRLADELGNHDGHVDQNELAQVELRVYAQLGYDIASFGSLRPITPLLTHWVAAMANQAYSLDGRACDASGFPGLGGLE